MERSSPNLNKNLAGKFYLPPLEKPPAASALARYGDNSDLETVFRAPKAESVL